MVQQQPDRVVCQCGKTIYDGEVLLSRITRRIGQRWYAKCRCKRLVQVPLVAARRQQT